jgi:hypothetical protein
MAVGTTYDAGNRITGVVTTGSVTVTTDNTLYRPQWSDCALVVGLGSTAEPPPNSFQALQYYPTLGAGWAAGYFSWDALGGTSDLNCTMLELVDGTNITRLAVRGAGSGAIKISKHGAGGFTDLATSATNAVPIGGQFPYSLDFQFSYTAVVTSGTRTDISFSGNMVSTVAGNFITDGFTPGGAIVVSGSVSNDGTYTLATVASGSMTITGSFTTEAAGNSLSITSTGTVSLWLNAVKVAYFAGGIETDGIVAVQLTRYGNCSSSQNINWSERRTSDTITINGGVKTLPALAAGTHQVWSGTAADINKTTINDTTFISDGNAGDLSGWTTTTTPPTGAWAIQSVVQEARVAVGTTGPQHFDWYLYVDSTDNPAGQNIGPSEFFGNFGNYVWLLNPSTSGAWGISDVFGGTFNHGVKALS